MNSETHRKAAEAALRRRAGMSRDRAQQVRTHFEAQDDLYTVCPRCGKRLRGTLAQIMAPHGCKET